jgi:hypothetical protein
VEGGVVGGVHGVAAVHVARHQELHSKEWTKSVDEWNHHSTESQVGLRSHQTELEPRDVAGYDLPSNILNHHQSRERSVMGTEECDDKWTSHVASPKEVQTNRMADRVNMLCM